MWLVNARTRTLEVMRLHERNGVYAGDQRVRAEPFDAIDAIELDLATLWAGLPLRASEGAADYAVIG